VTLPRASMIAANGRYQTIIDPLGNHTTTVYDTAYDRVASKMIAVVLPRALMVAWIRSWLS
jgi:hypothetical protein